MDWISFIGVLSEWLGVIAVGWILLVITRYQKRPVIFKYPRREGVVSLSLYALILILTVLVYQRVIQLPRLPVPPGLNILDFRAVVALLSLAPFAAALYLRRQPWLSAGWGRAKLSAALQLGLALAIITIFLRGKAPGILNGITSEEAISLLLCVVLALAEETIWRGYIQLRLSGWWGERLGWLATALLAVAWQIPRLILYPESFWFLVILAAGQALVLGWTAQKSGHTLGVALYRAVSEWIPFIT